MTMSQPQPSSQKPVPRANIGPPDAAIRFPAPPACPRSGYARKHPRAQDLPTRRSAPGEDVYPPDYGNAV